MDEIVQLHLNLEAELIAKLYLSRFICKEIKY